MSFFILSLAVPGMGSPSVSFYPPCRCGYFIVIVRLPEVLSLLFKRDVHGGCRARAHCQYPFPGFEARFFKFYLVIAWC
jgi:hypothetical protein